MQLKPHQIERAAATAKTLSKAADRLEAREMAISEDLRNYNTLEIAAQYRRKIVEINIAIGTTAHVYNY